MSPIGAAVPIRHVPVGTHLYSRCGRLERDQSRPVRPPTYGHRSPTRTAAP
ncbi:hypothetical protein [Ornithinimicrobium kibberense]|uniref:hypothetical protein n=1 Tax=Ornithinimicrobium kibberense TaxID=282060 RepID=UPI003622620C